VPCPDQQAAALAASLGREALAADEGALVAQQALKLAAIARVEPAGAALVARVELALALAVLRELGGGRGREGRRGDGGGGLYEGDG
jgi:hypothetical protein